MTDDTGRGRFDRAGELALMHAENAAAAALFGPVPDVLADARTRVVDAYDGAGVRREFVVFESDAASIFVYESPEHDGDVARFTPELFVSADVDTVADVTPARVRELAAMMIAAADEFERLQRAGVGVGR